MKCSLCTDPETDDNLVFCCNNCSVSVHALCYGIEDPGLMWLCSPCQLNILESVMCELCHQTDGAFKPTTSGKWVHTICALFTEGVRFENKFKMEPVDISHISKSKQNKKCSFCTQKKGFCERCSKRDCSNRIHITCAQQSKCLQEISNKQDDSLKFRAYCYEHKPKDSKRLSVGFVRKMVDKKGKKEKDEKRAQSSNLNADWLMTTTARPLELHQEKSSSDKMSNAHKEKKQQTISNGTSMAAPEKPLSQMNKNTSKGSKGMYDKCI